MGTEADQAAAQRTTFWQLIEECAIRIPHYQREYAQGRDNRRAELIREGFVSSLYEAIKNRKPLELDFIFGGQEEKDADGGQEGKDASFYPVDGQQRLTILFLLHWYIFMRAGKTEELRRRDDRCGDRDRFLYMTRTTSETFCKRICEGSFSFDPSGGDLVSSQLKDQPWFTGAMNSDPTVKSMLVVLDCLHKHFADTLDYEEAAAVLTSKDCPISFFCLDLNHELGIKSDIRDLYIKMNARGVPLTDFELFKADLQKKDSRDARFDLLAEYLKKKGTADTAEERVKIIGKFNNEYTNFFFRLIDGGKIVNFKEGAAEAKNGEKPKRQMFDVSMMNFINEIFRMNYFCAISEQGINRRAYRTDNDPFRKMSGKEFSTFIGTIGTCQNPFNKKYWSGDDAIPRESLERSVVDSFDAMVNLLNEVSAKGVAFDADDAPCHYSLGEMMKKYAVAPRDDKALPAKDSLVRMALYAFVLRFGIPQSEEEKAAFTTWSRFVWKIDRNSEFKNFDEFVEALRGYKEIVAACTGCTSAAIFKAIVDRREKGLSAPAKRQFEEEVIKTRLIQADAKWEEAITKAENAYSDCGQIWFLLDLSKRDDGGYDYDRFIRALALSEKIFDHARCVVKVDSHRFERALLAVKTAANDENRDHLLSMGKYTTDTKRFVGEKFSDHISHQYCDSSDLKEHTRYAITLELLRKMVDDAVEDVDGWLTDYIAAGSSSVDWKDVFIKNDLLGKTIPGLSFKNGFEPDAWKENGCAYTAVYTNQMKRTGSGELHSFLLATKLSDAGVPVHYHTDSSGAYLVDGFPSRYFTVKGMDVGYMNGRFYSRTDDGTASALGSEEEAAEAIPAFASGDRRESG